MKPRLAKRLRLLPLTLVVTLVVLTGLARDGLVYCDRGDRHEGTKPKPVGGYDIELLGATVKIEGAPAELPKTPSVRFFLERQEGVYVTVRERKVTKYYWLDKVAQTAWRSKATNIFRWPSQDVLRPLGLQPSDRVVLVRLGKDSPDGKERVAPATFPSSTGSQQITAYRFTFKTKASAKTRHRIFGPEAKEILALSPRQKRRADTPFDVDWKVGNAMEGNYRLRLEGYFLNDNTQILQEVEFYHATSWPP